MQCYHSRSSARALRAGRRHYCLVSSRHAGIPGGWRAGDVTGQTDAESRSVDELATVSGLLDAGHEHGTFVVDYRRLAHCTTHTQLPV